MEKPYAVVYFKEDETFSEIPAAWISPSKTSCWWPNTRNVASLIMRKVLPDENSQFWKTYDIDVVSCHATLEAARKKALDSDCTSEEDERGRGLRRKIRSHKSLLCQEVQSEADTSDSREDTPPPILTQKKDYMEKDLVTQAPRKFENVSNVIELDFEQESINLRSLKEGACSSNEVKTLTGLDENLQITDLMDKIDYLTQITKKTLIYVKGIEERLVKNEAMESKISSNIEKIVNKLPLQSTDEITKLDSIILKNEDFKDGFANYLRSIGGRTAKEMISRIMAKLITNSVGIQCSLLGKRSHFPFKNLNLLELIIAAVRHSFGTVSDSEVEIAVGEWLRLSKLRQSREKPSAATD